VGHTKPFDLQDVRDILDEVRTWEHINEKSPNSFYYRSRAFLHFHDKNGARWADVIDGKKWGKELALPIGASTRQKAAFLKEVTRRYKTMRNA
jgi:hypothetical protein